MADEHLYDYALERMDRDAASGKPFLMHLMTTSNHTPFTFPEGRIDLQRGRLGAAKYSDYAGGRFIEHARFMGRSVLRTYPDAGRAFIATYQKLGYLTPDQLVVLSPGGAGPPAAHAGVARDRDLSRHRAARAMACCSTSLFRVT